MYITFKTSKIMKPNIETIKNLREQANELINFGDSKEKAKGYGMLDILDTLFPNKVSETNFVTHNDVEIDYDGTCLVDEIKCPYRILKAIFGKPKKGDDYKTDAEWVIKFDDGKVATIYNYKDGKNYNGKHGIATTKLTDWHIGGRDEDVANRVKKIIEKYIKLNLHM